MGSIKDLSGDAGQSDPDESKTSLFEERERAEVTLRSIGDGVMSVDALGKVTYLNPAAERLTGWTTAQGVGRDASVVLQLIHEATGSPIEQPALTAMSQNHTASLPPDSLLVRRDGSTMVIEDSASPIHSALGATIGAVVVFRDTTATRALNAKILHQAEHDSLTDLPNRVLLNDRLSQSMSFADRHGKNLAVLFLDLDRFKNINDTHGHSVGDRLLKSVAQRLSGCVRHSDTVSRQGGDEFVIILNELMQARDAALTAEKISLVLKEPHRIDSHELYITASIGIASYPSDGDDVETLLKNADLALYLAKSNGRNGYQFFERKLRSHAQWRQTLEDGLRHALQNDELTLHYQPKIALRTGLLSGAEALLRWKHPSRGLIPAQDFIPVAEESGLIVQIGEWVLREACRQFTRWQQTGFNVPTVAVNISPAELSAPGLIRRVKDTITESGIDPRCLELELTETFLVRDCAATEGVLRALKSLGLSLALDDFGTGYSSLSHLRRYPIDTLKIDRSFVSGIPFNDGSCAIVSAVINMARSLMINVVAEGVESNAQRIFLADQQCTEGQGHMLGEPMAAMEFENTFRQVGVVPSP